MRQVSVGIVRARSSGNGSVFIHLIDRINLHRWTAQCFLLDLPAIAHAVQGVTGSSDLPWACTRRTVSVVITAYDPIGRVIGITISQAMIVMATLEGALAGAVISMLAIDERGTCTGEGA